MRKISWKVIFRRFDSIDAPLVVSIRESHLLAVSVRRFYGSVLLLVVFSFALLDDYFATVVRDSLLDIVFIKDVYGL